MAYPSQQPRYGNSNNNYYEAPRSAPLQSPREYRDDGYGRSQQGYGYDDGYGQGYGQDRRQQVPQQGYNQRDPRNAQGYQPSGRSQQRGPSQGRGPGPGQGRGQMRDTRDGGHRDRRGNNQPYGNGRDQRQDYHSERNDYSNNHQDPYQNQGQYDDGYGQEQYDDGYGYQQQNNYAQRQGSAGGRAVSNPQHGRAPAGYDQRPSTGQGRPGPNGIHPQRQGGERILQQLPHSPDSVSWDNPFPTFPAQEKRGNDMQRPSTASGRYEDRSNGSYGSGPQDAGRGYQGHQDGFSSSTPQPSYAQPQRSNTMPTDIAQNMSNLNLGPQGDSSSSHSRPNAVSHLNFSQPRRPSGGNQGSTNSRQQSQTRQPGGYNDIFNQYDTSPAETPHTQSAPFASPDSEEMPNFGSVNQNGPDKTLHMPAQGTNNYGDERGRQQHQGFETQDYRSQSQPAVNNQPGGYQETNQHQVSGHSTQSSLAQNAQNFPPRKTSAPQHQRNASHQQYQDQNGWQGQQQQQQGEFGPPSRAQTDMYGPGQAPQRNPSDPYQRAPSRGMGPVAVGQSRTSLSSQNGTLDPRGATSINSQRTSAESVNRPRPAMSPSNDPTAMNGRLSHPDSLPGHPAPVRPGLINQSHSPTNQAALVSRPPPVRNYNNGSSASYNQQGPSQAALQQLPSNQPPVRAQPVLPVAEGPVTYEELQRLRAQHQQNPADQALELHLAKRLVDAASTLADEGGRADPKTKSKNRDKYNMEANRIVKKLVGYNYTEALFYMAECYGSGTLGLPKDPAQAFTLYQSAAKLNHAGAAYRVAVCCELGSDEGGGTRRDPLKAVQWYQRAATLGDVPSMYKIGVIKLKGLLGQPQNHQEAVAWLRKAAEFADAENPHALHELALLYQNAVPNGPVPRDDAYAAQLLCQAAELGYKFSQFKLGVAYEFGQMGFPTDARQSITWYSKAATQDEHQSELALSGWYLTGAEGIMAQNDTEAYLWARKSANAGLPKAEYAMGYFTEVGIGCPADIEGAKRWYWKAASQNFPKARERLEELRRGGPKMQKARVSRGAMNRAQGFPNDLTSMGH